MEFKEFLVNWFTGVYDRVTLLEKLWGRDYGHPQRSFYTIELIDRLEIIILRDQKHGRPCFLSVNYYKGDIGKPGEPVALEKLFFDIDYPGHLDKAQKDARKLIDRLLAYCKPLLVFSGGKGYHVYCYVGTPIEGSKQFLKTVLEFLLDELRIHNLNLVSLDEKVVKDVSRLSRIPYTLHNKTKKQVTPLDYDFKPIEMESFDLDYYIGSPIANRITRKAVEQASIIESIEPKLRKHKVKRITWLRLFEDRKLFNAIVFEGRTFGEQPEEIAKQLALYLRNIEMKNLNECIKFLIEWCKNTGILSIEKVKRIASNYCS